MNSFGLNYLPFEENELSALEQAMQGMAPNPATPPPIPEAPVATPAPIAAPPPVQPTQMSQLPETPKLQPAQRTTAGLEPEAQGTVLGMLDQAREQQQGAAATNYQGALEGNAKLGSFYQDQAQAAEQQRVAAEEKLAREEAARQKLEASAGDLASRKDNPSEAFGGMEWAGALAAIGMASGVFSQAMGWQQNNPVKDMFEDIVNRSIASQREQKNSMLGTLEKRIGDRQAAESMARSELHNAIARRVKAQEAYAVNEADKTKLAGAYEQQIAEGAKWHAAAVADIAPKVQVTQTPPKPVGAGMSMVQRYNEAEALVKLRELTEDGGISPQRRAAIALKDKERNSNIEALSKNLGPVEDIRRSIDQTADAANLQRAKDGNYIQKQGTTVPGLEDNFWNNMRGKPLIQSIDPVKVGIPFTGIKTIWDPAFEAGMKDPATAKLAGALQNTMDLVGRMRSGGAISDAEWHSFSRIMMGTTPETFAQNMSQFRQFIDQKRRDVMDQADDETLMEFDRRRKR